MRKIKSQGRSRGSVLLLTVWTLSILSLLAVGASYYVWIEAKLTSIELDRIKEERLVQAAAELARQFLPTDLEKAVTLKDSWARADDFQKIVLDEGVVSLVIEDESGRVNLNSVQASALQSLLEDDDSDGAQAIVAWRQDTSDSAQKQSIDNFYASRPVPYPCKHAPFESVSELRLVAGMTPERYRKLSRWVTVFPQRININTASREVLSAIGLGASLADKIIAYRRGPDGIEGTQDDGIFSNVAEIEQDLPNLSSEEAGHLAAAAPLLNVSSRDFRMRVEVWPGGRITSGKPPIKYDVVLEFLTKGKWTIKQYSRG